MLTLRDGLCRHSSSYTHLGQVSPIPCRLLLGSCVHPDRRSPYCHVRLVESLGEIRRSSHDWLRTWPYRSHLHDLDERNIPETSPRSWRSCCLGAGIRSWKPRQHYNHLCSVHGLARGRCQGAASVSAQQLHHDWDSLHQHCQQYRHDGPPQDPWEQTKPEDRRKQGFSIRFRRVPGWCCSPRSPPARLQADVVEQTNLIPHVMVRGVVGRRKRCDGGRHSRQSHPPDIPLTTSFWSIDTCAYVFGWRPDPTLTDALIPEKGTCVPTQSPRRRVDLGILGTLDRRGWSSQQRQCRYAIAGKRRFGRFARGQTTMPLRYRFWP